MTAEFNVWLLLVGLIVGGGLTWLVIGELRRSDADVGHDERLLEADWIAGQLTDSDDPVSPDQAEAVLSLHRRYLARFLPPEGIDEADDGTDIADVADGPRNDGAPATVQGDPVVLDPGAAPGSSAAVRPDRRRATRRSRSSG